MRIFFGATLLEETKDEIIDIQRELRSLVSGARFEGRDKLHITLQFIGDFSSEKVEELYNFSTDQLKQKLVEPSAVDIIGLGYFPNENVRRGIWLDCRDSGTLAAIADSLRTSSKEFGIVPESRPFKAHITIARSKGHEAGGMKRIDLQKAWDEGKLSAKRFFPKSVALFQSRLLPSGSEYEVIHEFSLQ
ncbi:MAG: RNA 2',3'-cyclic phosphodiesterase [Bacteroidetes bacterium]|nr:RNA 2',3'-cyclic phosphodiesterase [Bacteroidota bacterium]